MPYPGPWQQGGDVTSTSTGFGYRNIRSTMTAGGRETYHPGGADNPDTLSVAATNERDRGAVPDWTADTYDSATYGCAVSCIVSIGPTQTAPYPFTTDLTHSETGFSVSAGGALTEQQANYAASLTLPPGATGVELAPEPFAVVSGAVTADMRDTGGTVNADAIPSTGLAIDYYARPVDQPVGSGRFVAQHMTRSDMSQADYPVGFVVDGSDLDATDDAAVIWPMVNFGSSPMWTVSGAGPLPRSGYWGLTRTFAVLSVSTVWTIRPPRHRFLYSAPQQTTATLPPLRQWPRADGLRGSTAVRHWPPDRSRQASNRHAGGYF